MARRKARRRITRRQLKEPDEFRTWASRLLESLSVHKVAITLSFLALIGVVLSLSLWRSYQGRREEVAFSLLGGGIEIYHQGGDPTEKLDQIIKTYPGTKGASLARLYRAKVSLNKGEWDKALDDLKVLSQKDLPSTLRVITYCLMGEAYMGKEEWEEAKAKFLKAKEGEGRWISLYALLKLALCEEREGHLKEAKSYYSQFLRLNPPEPLSLFSKLKIKELSPSP